MNGSSEGQLSRWVIVLTAGKVLLGKRDEGSGSLNFGDAWTQLSPVYELTCAVGPGPRGEIMVARQVTPLLTFSSVSKVSVPVLSSVFVSCSELSKKEQLALVQGIAQAEQLIRAMRADESGIVLAGPGVKLPEVKR